MLLLALFICPLLKILYGAFYTAILENISNSDPRALVTPLELAQTPNLEYFKYRPYLLW